MQRRFISVLVVVAIMLLAVPLAVTAVAPDVARISATSYQDLSRSRAAALCERDDAGTPSILTTVRYSGKGEDLGGNGTGELAFAISGSTFEMSGEVEVNGETKTITGGGTLSCLFGGLAVVTGQFVAEGESGTVYGDLLGTITDGAHRNQGSVSLTLTEGDPPPVTSLDVLVTLDGAPVAGVSVNIYEGGVCGVGTSIAGLTGADGVASFEVQPDVLYCASADPNNDVTFSEAVTSVPEGDPVDVDATIAETSVPDVISVDVLVTLDAAPASGVTVTFYSDATCTTSVGTAVTDINGVASLPVSTSGTYCASADPNADSTVSNTGAMTIDPADPVDTDGTIAESTPVVTFLDATVSLGGAPVSGVPVYVQFVGVGACSATNYYASLISGADGTVSFELSEGDVGTGYNFQVCSDPNGDGTLSTSVVFMSPGDPADDGDVTINETSQVFVDIVVTLDGSPVAGTPVTLCLTFVCSFTTQTVFTDINGRATFNDPNIFTAGESVTASANPDGAGTPVTTTFVLTANDPAGDTDATLADFAIE